MQELFAGKPGFLCSIVISCEHRLVEQFHILEVRYTVVGCLTIETISSGEGLHLADCQASTTCGIGTQNTAGKQHSFCLGKELNTLVAGSKNCLINNSLNIFKTDRVFNIGAIGVIVILTILYVALW